MESGKTLIDQVSAAKGWSRYKIAQELGANESFLGQIYRGTKPMPPALAARLAAIAGQNPRESALAALIEQEKDAAMRAELAQLFGIAHVRNEAPSAAANDSASVSAQTETVSRAKAWRKRSFPNLLRRVISDLFTVQPRRPVPIVG